MIRLSMEERELALDLLTEAAVVGLLSSANAMKLALLIPARKRYFGSSYLSSNMMAIFDAIRMVTDLNRGCFVTGGDRDMASSIKQQLRGQYEHTFLYPQPWFSFRRGIDQPFCCPTNGLSIRTNNTEGTAFLGPNPTFV